MHSDCKMIALPSPCSMLYWGAHTRWGKIVPIGRSPGKRGRVGQLSLESSRQINKHIELNRGPPLSLDSTKRVVTKQYKYSPFDLLVFTNPTTTSEARRTIHTACFRLRAFSFETTGKGWNTSGCTYKTIFYTLPASQVLVIRNNQTLYKLRGDCHLEYCNMDCTLRAKLGKKWTPQKN